MKNTGNGYDFSRITAFPAEHKTVKLGSLEAKTGFKFLVELSTRGAGIRKATLSEYDDRDPDRPQPLALVKPVRDETGQEVLSLATGGLDLGLGQAYPLPLDALDWKLTAVDKDAGDFEQAVFEAVVEDRNGKAALRLTKTYRVTKNQYHLTCSLEVENLCSEPLAPRVRLVGPVGIEREDIRGDMRKVIGGFREADGQIATLTLDTGDLRKAQTDADRRLTYKHAGTQFLWAAAVNKYFAGILRPVSPEEDKEAGWLEDKLGRFYDADGIADSGDETIGLEFTCSTKLTGAGGLHNKESFHTELYLGPKDKSLFEKDPLYDRLGYVHTIQFRACCTFGFINSLAFAILALMKWMYGFIPNYGVVIIILVFIVRLALHPITKRSQVSMMKMGKLGPQAEEIKKKYANNKQEMQKRLMELYKQQGATPIMGCLPMALQMPIWIALYSAIYASVDLRGAEFLPVWITDLSAPDALVRFSAVTVPLLGWKITSFNLLPLLLGVGIFMQQKMMPHTSTATANPQMAQQQKMMQWMMPVMLLIFLYPAPSGLNLYIMASTFAGVIEQYVIRKHIREKEQQEDQVTVPATSKTGGKAKKKKPKPFYKY